VIPIGTQFIFYPHVPGGQKEASGKVVDTNDYGAFVLYRWVHAIATINDKGEPEIVERKRKTCEFFGWDELQRIHVKSLGGLCE